MACSLCGHRKGRRACPAVGQTICAACCGSKRLVEIRCPASCVYLASAREHPAAAVKRQQEQDLGLLLPTLRGLSERQLQLFFLLQTAITRHQGSGLLRLVDVDVAEAAAAVASTLETSAKGVIYEHTPQSIPAQQLAAELKTLVADLSQRGGSAIEREAAAVLRRIEVGARGRGTANDGGETAYLALIARLVQQQAPGAGPAGAGPEQPAPSLIIP